MVNGIELSGAVYGLLILGVGYIIQWIRYRFHNKLQDFYELSAFDKTMQVLIIGSIAFISTLYLSGTPIEEVATLNFSPGFLLLELFIITYIWEILIGYDILTSKRPTKQKGRYEFKRK